MSKEGAPSATSCNEWPEPPQHELNEAADCTNTRNRALTEERKTVEQEARLCILDLRSWVMKTKR